MRTRLSSSIKPQHEQAHFLRPEDLAHYLRDLATHDNIGGRKFCLEGNQLTHADSILYAQRLKCRGDRCSRGRRDAITACTFVQRRVGG